MRNVFWMLALATVFSASSAFGAGTYSMSFSNYQTSQVTPTGSQPYHNMIQFDLNTVDINDDQYNKPYEMTFLGLVLEFKSSAQYAKRVETGYYRGIPAPAWALGQYWYERDRYTIYEDATRDTVEAALEIDGNWKTFTRSVKYQEQSVEGARIDEGATTITDMGWVAIHRRFTQEHTTHKGWYGDVTLALISMPGNSSVFDNGVLNVYYDWTVGQGSLANATAVVGIEPNPLPPLPAAPVPSSLLLCGSGLAWLRLVVRRKLGKGTGGGRS